MAIINKLIAIADAIRSKTGKSGTMTMAEMPAEIMSISGGIDPSDATATASDILSPKTAYIADGTKATGNIQTRTSSDLTVSGATVTAAAGYYASNTSKSVASGSVTVATPTVSSSGLVTASASVSAGYVSSNPSNKTLQLSTQAASTITPSTTNQTAVASGKYTTGNVTVAGDANLIAGNIKTGVSIFGVTGTYSGGGTNTGIATSSSSSSSSSIQFTVNGTPKWFALQNNDATIDSTSANNRLIVDVVWDGSTYNGDYVNLPSNKVARTTSSSSYSSSVSGTRFTINSTNTTNGGTFNGNYRLFYGY